MSSAHDFKCVIDMGGRLNFYCKGVRVARSTIPPQFIESILERKEDSRETAEERVLESLEFRLQKLLIKRGNLDKEISALESQIRQYEDQVKKKAAFKEKPSPKGPKEKSSPKGPKKSEYTFFDEFRKFFPEGKIPNEWYYESSTNFTFSSNEQEFFAEFLRQSSPPPQKSSPSPQKSSPSPQKSSPKPTPDLKELRGAQLFAALKITTRKEWKKWLLENHADRNSNSDPELVAIVNSEAGIFFRK
jgi:hypothetical protein